MRLPWTKAPDAQLDLLEAQLDAASPATSAGDEAPATEGAAQGVCEPGHAAIASTGLPLLVSIALIDEDPNNPRTEFPDAEIDELADDIRQHGVLQPLVVHPVDAQGRYRLHFGAKRLRAAKRAGLTEVPVVLRDTSADPYAQVAENQKRHGLAPLDLARFIKGRVESGESNAFVAGRLGMNLTTVAHHLSLLDLPPVLDQALKSGRCTSPRTLHELSVLHDTQPERVRALVDGEAAITRSAVASMKAERSEPTSAAKPTAHADAIARANAACGRLERALAQVERPDSAGIAPPDLVALRMRVEGLAKHWLQGSDCQTP